MTNNAVTEEDFYDAYISLYDSLVIAFDAALIPDKYFIGMVLDNDTMMTDKIRFKVKTQFASETQMAVNCDEMFDRDYYIGAYQNCSDSNLSGSCDATVDDTNGICLMATYLNELIQEDLMDNNPDPQNYPWFGGFIGDVVDFVGLAEFYANYNPNYGTEDHPLKFCLMVMFFSSDFTGETDYCISEENLNWLLCNHYDIAKSYTLQPGKQLAMVDLFLDFTTSGNDALHGSFMEIYEGVPFFKNTTQWGNFTIGVPVPYESLMQSVITP